MKVAPMRLFYPLVVPGLLIVCWPLPAAEPGRAVQTFQVQEHFGVNHPDQVIDFDLAQPVDPKNCYLLGPEGQEVPYQVVEGGKKLAFRANLPAGDWKTWRLMAGRAQGPVAGGVTVRSIPGGLEITNGLTGVRVPAAAESPAATPAPIQGLRYRDCTWTAAGPNNLSVRAKSMTVRFLEKGPIKTVVEVAYVLDRPELKRLGQVVLPAGEGYYRSTIKLQIGQPSILVEEEADTDVSYSLNVYLGLQPSQARYCGHHSTSVEAGREADGKQYRMSHERSIQEALMDLKFDRPRSYRRMAVWDPWIFDSGWYWQLYDARAPGSGNLFGIFAGRASRALGCGVSGVSLWTDREAAGIKVECNRRNPNTHVYPHVRFQWGIFMGVKGQDLAAPDHVQAIERQMNLHSGFNLNKVHRYQLDYPDPPQGYGAMYVPRQVLDRTIARLRADTKGKHGGGFYSYLYTADPYAREMVDFWFDSSQTAAARATESVSKIGREVLDAFVNGHGIQYPPYHYWHGASVMTGQATWIDQLLASSATSAEESRQLKATAALFGYLMWDDDFVPLHEGHGLNLGTPNMPVMQQNARNLYAVLLAGHPMMKTRVDGIRKSAEADLAATVNEHGAHIGSVHYVGASMYPLLGSFEQLKMLGRYDAFRSEDRLARFAEFYMHFLTPPEVRFGGLRKLVSIGDGSTEGTTMYGQLAAGYADARPDLSARLMGAWQAVGKTHNHFQGSSYLKTDEELPASDPKLASATFPGWCSVLRYGWGTPQETALWVVNGDYYIDHYHNDNGSLAIYALGSPLSIDWGPIYYPRVAGGLMHNVVLPESALGHPWDKGDESLDAGGRYWKATQERFLSQGPCEYARSSYRLGNDLKWTRAVWLVHANLDYPVILLRDTFAGPQAGANKVLTLNLMAEGDVETPAGRVSPPLRKHPRQADTSGPDQLPSAGKVFALPAGVGRLRFTGQVFRGKEGQATGIDWDLYTISPEPQQAQVGNWAHIWHPTPEEAEFVKSQRRPFEERQHILRIRGHGPFTTVILPWRKGQKRDGVQVTEQGGRVTISVGAETTEIGPTAVQYRDGQNLITVPMSGG